MEIIDVIVVGGGHAGCEAAAAAAKLGSRVLLITMDMTKFAQMSCNPAMGGIAKGQIVREIDALGGHSAVVTDRSTIQFRMLNTSKGAAVWSPRAQCDRVQFSLEWRKILEAHPNISLWQDAVNQLIIENNAVVGVKTALGIEFAAPAVILTAGTFLNGKMFVGKSQTTGGRSGDAASYNISEQLNAAGIASGRMKTGTSMRVDGRTIDFAALQMQHGDDHPCKFSFADETTAVQNQLPCYIAQTNEEAHDILRAGFADSPMFSGVIKGTGPRYCPSIEDKLRVFADKTSHHLFIEPEGRNTCEYYINGFSSSLPFEVQVGALRKIKGFEHSQVFRPGYAVEYDYFPPTQLHHTLESKIIGGLYFAGQVNGTTGYEEAAGQGFVAGVNAHQKIHSGQPFVLERHHAYLGVLIDDLVTKGVDEPYRMFTSRAEHRILLRQDNADLRLAPLAQAFGLLVPKQIDRIKCKNEMLNAAVAFLHDQSVTPAQINPILQSKAATDIAQPQKLADILSRPEIVIADLQQLDFVAAQFADLPPEMYITVESAIKYQGYEKREQQTYEKMSRLRNIKIPAHFDFTTVSSLSIEAQQKLQRLQPATIADAQRISGVSPSDIAALLVRFGR
ncbi:tRNA uridine 5-carboxymethylaminomethyl modification enzyme MnmG [Bacteroidia bacterium]|nr:tRNA uridine 5-carboxymethylaminomethyl modification enzyme MnmG [Bacteroidia bacterium]